MNPGFVEAGGKEAARHPLMAADDALKRSTDCIYFLASPLTCKKGRGCEYRHSEGARANPIDCRYWLNGNCLKLRCSFRHPKLDGLVGTSFAPKTETANVPSKQSVPCNFFQKGRCLKGDKCPFMHWPQWAAGAAEIPAISMQAPKESSSNGLDEQLEAAPLAANPVARLPEIHYPLENGAGPDQLFPKGRNADKLFLADSSPGFDVIVDDGSGYIHDEDDLPRDQVAHSGRHHHNHRDYEKVGNGGLEQICYSREMIPDGRLMPKRHREELDGSDLRHRLLLKRRRRSNGSISASHADEERDDPIISSQRLQGRITLPPAARLQGRERGSIRHRITFLPMRNQKEDSTAPRTRRRSRARPVERDNKTGGGGPPPSNFAAPKSLAELKGSKASEKSIGSSTLGSSQESISFEGPMPLTDILKKREEDKGSSSSSEAGTSGLEFIEEEPILPAASQAVQSPPATYEVEDEDSMMVDNAAEFDEEDDFVNKVIMLYG